MIIYIGTDHNGYRHKKVVMNYLKSLRQEAIDCGDALPDPEDDFPIFASRVANAVLTSENTDSRGILICGSGQGMVMAANRFKGIRAGLGYDTDSAKSIRNDEDSNILSLPSSVFKNDEWKSIIRVWLRTPFADADRYKRRNAELDTLTDTDRLI